MPQLSPQWVYSALVGMSLLMIGWLWQIVGNIDTDVTRLAETKAEKTQASDRWTGSQQVEYMRYVEARFRELENRQNECMAYLKKGQ